MVQYNIYVRLFLKTDNKGKGAMEELKLIIAKNISTLRKEKQMTQFELAEILNYSDKAVSKWERGESVPDVAVLKSIADFFSVSVDYLLEEAHPKKRNFGENFRIRMKNHSFIMGMSIMLVWLVALLIFVIGDTVRDIINLRHWFTFMYAVPISLIVWLVFNSVWFNRRRNFLIISLLMWSCLICIYISFLVLGHINIRFLPLLGFPGQIIIIMWSKIQMKK